MRTCQGPRRTRTLTRSMKNPVCPALVFLDIEPRISRRMPVLALPQASIIFAHASPFPGVLKESSGPPPTHNAGLCLLRILVTPIHATFQPSQATIYARSIKISYSPIRSFPESRKVHKRPKPLLFRLVSMDRSTSNNAFTPVDQRLIGVKDISFMLLLNSSFHSAEEGSL